MGKRRYLGGLISLKLQLALEGQLGMLVVLLLLVLLLLVLMLVLLNLDILALAILADLGVNLVRNVLVDLAALQLLADTVLVLQADAHLLLELEMLLVLLLLLLLIHHVGGGNECQ